jgi:hypothetical protein
MPDALLTPETLTLDTVAALLDVERIAHERTAEGYLAFRDRFTCWLLVSKEDPAQYARLFTTFGFRDEASESARVQLANRVNREVAGIRAAAMDEHLLLDEYLWVTGGIAPKQLLLRLRAFPELVEAALRRDTDAVLQ